MSQNLSTRLNALERLWQRGKCKTCFNTSVRIIGVLQDTGALISETMPESGCPTCGRSIASTIVLTGIDPLKV